MIWRRIIKTSLFTLALLKLNLVKSEQRASCDQMNLAHNSVTRSCDLTLCESNLVLLSLGFFLLCVDAADAAAEPAQKLDEIVLLSVECCLLPELF